MPMNTYTLKNCHTATGTVVVIDVIRAFTTAAYAFANGAERILLAGEVDQAFALRERFPGSLIAGELGGVQVQGFDLWNSPAEVSRLDLTGKTVIQRTSSGTQGAIRSTAAGVLLASSFVVAEATVRMIQQADQPPVGFVTTGVRPDNDGGEDVALAEYLSARLAGEHPDPRPYLARVSSFDPRRVSDDPDVIARFEADLALCSQIDQFSFGLQVQRKGDLVVLQAVQPHE